MPTTRDKKGQSLLKLLDDYVVVDIETTGLSSEHNEIIEIGAIRVVGGKIIDKRNALIKPNRKIPLYITQLTGISNEMVATAPPIKDVLPKFLEFISDSVVVGHNVHFDINFLYDNLLRHHGTHLQNNFIDTMRLSRHLFKDFENHQLGTLVAKFGITTTAKHRALPDCQVTHECYEYMKNYMSTNNIDLKEQLKQKRASAAKRRNEHRKELQNEQIKQEVMSIIFPKESQE